MEIVRFYSEKDEVRPQTNRNNYTDVFDWFLGTENNQACCSASTISKESPIVKVLMASPQVQMSFSNPKMFIGEFAINSTFLTKYLINFYSIFQHICPC